VTGENARTILQDLSLVVDNTTMITNQSELIGNSLSSVADKTEMHAEKIVMSGMQLLI